jgi:hypothetical protein
MLLIANSSLDPKSFKGQRSIIASFILRHKEGVTRESIAKYIAEEADYPLKHGKSEQAQKTSWFFTQQENPYLASVNYHVRGLLDSNLIAEVDETGKSCKAREQGPPQESAAATPEAPAQEPDRLLSEWEQWTPRGLPFALDADRETLAQSSNALAIFGSWSQAIGAPDFGQPGDTRLHLGLLPQPFIGDLRRASIYVLSLNPGLEPSDYYGEYEIPAYRDALLGTLKQQFYDCRLPFMFLDPRYSWHGGFRWWHGKLAQVLTTFANEAEVSFASARATLAAQLASIELLPYHSSKFSDAGGWLTKLKSVDLAKTFVKTFVLPRVERGEAIAIVLRKVALWELPKIPGVILSEGKHAQGAHLDPGSAGGRAILAKLRTTSVAQTTRD